MKNLKQRKRRKYMTNLNALQKDTLINIILDLDYQLNQQQSLEAQNLQVMLNKAYNDNNELNSRRQYWKDKALNYEKMLKDAGLIKVEKRVTAQDKPKKEKKEFKINVIRDGKKINTKDLPVKEVKPVVEEPVELIDIKLLGKQKETYKHSVESAKGNIHKTKHSGHKTKNEVLIGIFPNGDVVEFDSVEEAKDEVRKRFPKLKTSPLTNISRSARRSGFYKDGISYGVKWSYQAKEEVLNTEKENE
jgi:hypothetical protein